MAVAPSGKGIKSLLRFITVADAGALSLTSALFADLKMTFEDQAAVVSAGERNRGITTDLSYRSFSTDKRRFLVAEISDNAQTVTDMAAAVATADLVVILVDARKGVVEQTRRHSFLAALWGVRKAVLAVSKMNLVGYSQEVFDRITADFRAFAQAIGLGDVVAIPVSSVHGASFTQAGANMPWYAGPSLMSELETVAVQDAALSAPFRMWVQAGSHARLHDCSGVISSGTIRVGDRVKVLPSARESRVERIITPDGDVTEAVAGQSATLTLENEISVSRGDMLATAEAAPSVSDQFNVTLVWMSEAPLFPGRSYQLQIGTRLASATVTEIKHKVNVNTLEHLAAKSLELNEIAVVNLSLDHPVPFDPYLQNRETGGFILIDRMSNATSGAGMIHFALRRAENIHWQAVDLNKTARATLKRQKACVLWFTGLSGAGKSTIANLIEKQLFAQGRHTYLLDGDNVRHGLNRDLGFTETDRVENIRRVAEVAKLMADAGLIVLVSFISPFRAERRLARDLMAQGEFFEVFVDAPLSVAEGRDPKGLYKKARRGEIKNFTGIDSPYEPPEHAEIVIDTTVSSAEDAARLILKSLEDFGLLAGVRAGPDTTPTA